MMTFLWKRAELSGKAGYSTEVGVVFKTAFEFSSLSSHYFGLLVPSGEYRLVILDSMVTETVSAARWAPEREELVATSVVAAASGFNEVTELGYWLSQFVGLVTSDEYQLVIHDSVAGGMRCGYGDGSSAFCWTIHTCSLRQATVRQP
jgi:hypothetical protein